MTKDYIINIKNLRKHYIEKTEILKGINCKINSGTILSIIGPNGAGKTTLLRILATLLIPSSGQFWVQHFNSHRDFKHIRRLVGYCPDELPIDGKASGFEFLEFFADLYSKDHKKIEEILEFVDLTKSAFNPISTYSRGMIKRVNLARVLLIDPQVILLDEPTSSLDPPGQRKIQNIILEMERKNKVIIVCSHNLYEVERISDEIQFLQDGKLKKIDSVDEVFEEEKGPIIIDLILKNIDYSLLEAIEKDFKNLKVLSKSKHHLRFSTITKIEKNDLLTYINSKGGDVIGIKFY